MKRIALGVALGALLASSPGLSQQANAPQLPDVPVGPAALRGRVVHGDRPETAANVPVILYALPAAGQPGLRQTTTDAEGHFAFENISNDPNTAYLVGTRVGGLPFGDRVVFGPGERERTVELRVRDATADPDALKAGEARVRIDWLGGRLRVTETHSIENSGERIFFTAEDERAGARPALRAALPEGASRFHATLLGFGTGLVRDGSEVVYWGPVYPGDHKVSFSYEIPAPERRFELRKSFPSGATPVRVLIHESVAEASSPKLRAGDPESLEGAEYRSLEAPALAPGDSFALVLLLPEAETDRAVLAAPEVRIWLELDDAALRVDEEHRIEVEGALPLVAGAGEPLLRLSLPARAKALRLGSGTLGLGVGAADGGMAVQGPLPPGESVIAFRYHIPVQELPARFERELAHATSLLSIFVADTGVAIDTDRMHRRRPIRTTDRFYLHLEAFEMTEGERVALTLSPLARRAGPGRVSRLATAALLGLAAAWFLMAPLRKRDGRGLPELEEDEDGASSEREAIYASIRDLDHDFETGKFEEKDYQRARDELRRRAVELLRQERARAETRAGPAAPPEGPPLCPRCGTRARTGDRFCAQCGRALAAPAPASRQSGAGG